MAHYALLDENNIVVNVIAGVDEDEGSRDWEQFYQELYGMTCKRTSYNTHNGVHTAGGVPFRGNYAGAGYTYDEALNVFLPPKPYPSWSLNYSTWSWDPPKPFPEYPHLYDWSEQEQDWVPKEFDYGPMTDEDYALLAEAQQDGGSTN
jgi:hypothetical protein